MTTSRSAPRQGDAAQPSRKASDSADSTAPAKHEPARARVEIRHIDPVSALKFAMVFNFCLMLILWVGLAIIYVVLSANGTVNSLASLLGKLIGSSTAETDSVAISGIKVFEYLLVMGTVVTIAWSLVEMLAVVVYNMISDMLGGIKITLADRK